MRLFIKLRFYQLHIYSFSINILIIKITINYTYHKVLIHCLGVLLYVLFFYQFFYYRLKLYCFAYSYPSFHKQRIYIYLILN